MWWKARRLRRADCDVLPVPISICSVDFSDKLTRSGRLLRSGEFSEDLKGLFEELLLRPSRGPPQPRPPLSPPPGDHERLPPQQRKWLLPPALPLDPDDPPGFPQPAPLRLQRSQLKRQLDPPPPARPATSRRPSSRPAGLGSDLWSLGASAEVRAAERAREDSGAARARRAPPAQRKLKPDSGRREPRQAAES